MNLAKLGLIITVAVMTILFYRQDHQNMADLPNTDYYN